MKRLKKIVLSSDKRILLMHFNYFISSSLIIKIGRFSDFPQQSQTNAQTKESKVELLLGSQGYSFPSHMHA